jgi:hypothetical protein
VSTRITVTRNETRITLGAIPVDTGSSPADVWTVVELATDVVESTGTLTSTPLEFTPVASGIYDIEYVLTYTAAATTTGISHQIDQGNAAQAAGWFASRGTAYTNQNVSAPTLTGGAFPAAGQSSGTGWTLAWGRATIQAASSSPTAVSVQIATEVASSAITLKAYASHLRYRRAN